MSYRAILLIVGLLVVATNSTLLRRRYRKPRPSANLINNDFNHYVLAQVLPQAQCYLLNRLWREENSTCSPCAETWARNDTDWALHGLWPSHDASATSAFLADCNRTARFDPSQLDASLRADLEYHWADMRMAADQDAFWRHEWEKHGTCAMHVAGLSGVRNYFRRTIELLKRYNVGHYLETQGIVPGEQYDVDEFGEAIFKAYGARAKVKCSKSPMTGRQYINEVHLCMDKSFEMIDCAGALMISCNKRSKITYVKNANDCAKSKLVKNI